MPINQIPFSNLHKNFTISGTTNANARVMLFNPNENRYVKAVDADANGNYNFGNINSSVPLQIKLASSNYFNCISTSETVEPAVSFNTTKGKVIRGIQSVFQLNQNYIWAGAPKIVFSDAAGIGSGASAFFTMAGQGELALTGFGSGTPVAFDLGTGPDGSPWNVPGYTLKSYTMTSFGSNYTSPKCFIIGNRLTWEQDLSQPGFVYKIVSTAVSVEMSLISPIGTAGDLIDENNFLTSIGITWGQSNTWGNFSNSNNTGNRLLAQIPGYSNINYNASCNTADNTQPGPVLQEKIVEIMAATKNPKTDAVWMSAEYQLYLAIIHGFDYTTFGDYVVTGQPRSWDNTKPNNNFSNSAFTLQSNGVISAAELEYLKGWLAQAVQVNAMVNKLNSDFLVWKTNNTDVLTATGYLNTGLNVLFGLAGETIHQLGDTIKRWNDANAHNTWGTAPVIVYDDGTTVITRPDSKSLVQVFWQEWQQSKLRVPAIIDAATGDTKTIKKILNKMNNVNNNYLTGIRTNDSTGTYRWDFSGDTLQKIQVN